MCVRHLSESSADTDTSLALLVVAKRYESAIVGTINALGRLGEGAEQRNSVNVHTCILAEAAG